MQKSRRTGRWWQFRWCGDLLWQILFSSKSADASEREEATKVKGGQFPGQGHVLTIWCNKVAVLRVILMQCQTNKIASPLCTEFVFWASLSVLLCTSNLTSNFCGRSLKSCLCYCCPGSVPWPFLLISASENYFPLTPRPHSGTQALFQSRASILVNTGRLRARLESWERMNGLLRSITLTFSKPIFNDGS